LANWLPMEPQKLEYIDALRGWAILLVILVHAVQAPTAIDALHLPPWQMRNLVLVSNELIARICLGGEVGVQLFFVASALSLTLSWHARHPTGIGGVRDYLLRRFFRVAPMFYFGIGLYLLLFGWGPRRFAPDGIGGLDVALTALFLHGWWPTAINSVVPGGWSIADEAMFYLILPGFMLLVRSLTWLTITTVAAVAASHVLFAYLIQHFPLEWSFPPSLWIPMLRWGFQNQAPNFLFGIVAAAVLMKWPNRASQDSRWRWEGLAAVVLFAVMILQYSLMTNPWVSPTTIFSTCAAGLCVLLHRSPIPILVNPVMTRIGRVSFSMYILHFALLAPVFGLVVTIIWMLKSNSAVIFPVYFPLLVGTTFVVASITFALIEAPFMALGRRLIARLQLSVRLRSAPADQERHPQQAQSSEVSV
jgi:peptidoglycan/LPS O-acetylase OafA/YrhL